MSELSANEAGNLAAIRAETVPPWEDDMTIPTTPGRFKNWLAKQRHELPPALYSLGDLYGRCLTMIALNRNNADALKAAKRVNAAAMREFMSAYADWSKSR